MMTDSLHIAFILPGYPPESHAGGIATYGQLVAVELTKRGHSVSVLSRSTARERLVEVIDGVRVIRLPGPASGPRGLDLSDFAHRIRDEWDRLNAKEPIHYTECVDWGGEGVLLAERRTLCKLAVRLHSPGYVVEELNPENPPYLAPASKMLERRLVSSARYILANSQAAFELVRSALSARTDLIVSPYVYPERVMTAPRPRCRDGFRTIVSTGRIEPRKGQDLLIEAIELLGPSARLRLVLLGSDTPHRQGGSYLASLLDERPEWLKSRVSWAGSVSHEAVFDHLAACHFAVQPARFENFAFAMLEPMSVGRPVLVPDLPTLEPLTRLIPHLTFSSNSVEALCSLLQRMLSLEDDGMASLSREVWRIYHEQFACEASFQRTWDAILTVAATTA